MGLLDADGRYCIGDGKVPVMGVQVGGRLLLVGFLLSVVMACNGQQTENPAEQSGSIEADADEEVRQQPYPFEGLWANSFTDCSLRPGMYEASPVLFTASQSVGLETICEITDVTMLDVDAGRYEITRSCSAEGQNYSEVILLRVSGDTLMKQSDSGNVTWTRCPE